jgi:hypothetical protein
VAVDPVVAYGPTTTLTTGDTYIRRGITTLGLARGDVGTFFYDFNSQHTTASPPSTWNIALAGSGATDAVTKGDGGNVTLSTGATGSSAAVMQTAAGLISDPRGKPWYLACRKKYTTAMDSQAKEAFHIYDAGGGNAPGIGYSGTVDSTNFVIMANANFSGTPTVTSLGVAVDTALHSFECWSLGVGNVLYGRMDGGATVTLSMTVAATSTQYGMIIDIRNNTTAANRAVVYDYVCAVHGRA